VTAEYGLNETVRMQLAIRSLNKKRGLELDCECCVCKLLWLQIRDAQCHDDTGTEKKLINMLWQHEDGGYHYDSFYN
jgi:hypothetical protein